MKRDISKLKENTFDVLVVGGGVYGAWIACDAALRGLKTAIIDKGDWASGTSSASTKLIHGGLRYLENLRFDLVRKSLEERKRLTELFPHMVTPLKFLMPVYQHSRVGTLRLRAGLIMYDLLAGKDQPVDPHQAVDVDTIAEGYPFLRTEELKGGFTYGDCQTDDFRFTLNVIRTAFKAGAVTANYVKAETPLFNNETITGVKAVDVETGRGFQIKARALVSATGPWMPVSGQDRPLSDYIRLSKGVHLIMPPLPTNEALLLMTEEDNRIIFAVPWYGKTILGTTDADFEETPDDVPVTSEDVNYLLGEVNRFFNKIVWKPSDVIGKFAGLRALKNEPGKPPSEVTREWSFVEPVPGVFVSIGGKLTSARMDATRLVDRVVTLLGFQITKDAYQSKTETLMPASSPDGDYQKWHEIEMKKNMRAGMDPETSFWTLFRHGTNVKKIRGLIGRKAGLAKRLLPNLPFSKADAVFCAENEMTVHLEDLLRRRIPLMILSRPNKRFIKRFGRLVGKRAGWSFWRRRCEVNGLLKKLRISQTGVEN